MKRFQYPRVFPGNLPLSKDPDDSRYKINARESFSSNFNNFILVLTQVTWTVFEPAHLINKKTANIGRVVFEPRNLQFHCSHEQSHFFLGIAE